LLAGIAGRLGYDQAAFKQMLDMVLNNPTLPAGRQHRQCTGRCLQGAGRNQGVPTRRSSAPTATDEPIPSGQVDGQGVPEDMIAMATEQAKEIRLRTT